MLAKIPALQGPALNQVDWCLGRGRWKAMSNAPYFAEMRKKPARPWRNGPTVNQGNHMFLLTLVCKDARLPIALMGFSFAPAVNTEDK